MLYLIRIKMNRIKTNYFISIFNKNNLEFETNINSCDNQGVDSGKDESEIEILYLFIRIYN